MPLAHSTNPFEVVETARHLYSFAGEALLCRIPARQFKAGDPLTWEAEKAARSAARLVEERLAEQVAQHRTSS